MSPGTVLGDTLKPALTESWLALLCCMTVKRTTQKIQPPQIASGTGFFELPIWFIAKRNLIFVKVVLIHSFRNHFFIWLNLVHSKAESYFNKCGFDS